MKSGCATRTGDIPVECFKALADGPGFFLQDLLNLFNDCLRMAAFPDDWVTSRVVLIFKKGDPASCANYRPISILAIAYKVFAPMMKNRLLDAGADARLWPSVWLPKVTWDF